MSHKVSLPAVIERAAAPSRTSLRGLDWFVFSIANVQTGFGPFIAIYLTAQKWTQVDIGLLLTVGSLVSLIGQIPGGALVDAVRSERRAAMVAVAVIAFAALVLALWPILGDRPRRAGPARSGELRSGPGHRRDQSRPCRPLCDRRIGWAVMRALRRLEMASRRRPWARSATLLSNQAVFFFTAALCVPTLIALSYIKDDEVDPTRAHGGVPDKSHGELASEWGFIRSIAGNRALMIFAACVVLFQLANAAMLPLIGSMVTMRSSQWAHRAGRRLHRGAADAGRGVFAVGRSPGAALGTSAAAAARFRGARRSAARCSCASHRRSYLLVAVQILDGISAAIFGVMFRWSSPTSPATPGASTWRSASSAARWGSARRSAPRWPATCSITSAAYGFLGLAAVAFARNRARLAG